jgi:hypothetical protein
MTAEVEIAERIDATVKISMPYSNIFFLPYMSAILPKGTRNTAEAKRKDVATQLSKTASIGNSVSIEGRAMLIEEAIKGVRKELSVVTNKTDHLFTG